MDTKKLRQKILDLAIRGKLVPQDPNDEPASVLLERIRAEKEQLIKEGKIKRSKKSAASDTSHYENVPFEVPESWCWGNLLNVCHIFGRIGFRGYTKEDLVAYDGAITLSPSNIIDGKMNYNTCTYISWNKYDESPEIQIQDNDILLVKTGSSYGKCALVEKLPKQATINPQFVVLKHISCNPEYLTYVLQSKYAQYNYEKFVLGTAIPTFTQVALGNMQIPIPPLSEQNRIVTEIKRLLAIIESLENNQRHLKEVLALSKSKILEIALSGKLIPQNSNDEPAIELLTKINPAYKSCDNRHYANVPYKVPQKWQWVTLSDISNYGECINVPVSNIPENSWILELEDIEKDSGRLIQRMNRSKKNINGVRHSFKKGDVLYSKLRTYLNKVLVADQDGYCTTEIIPITCVPGIVPEYLCHVLRSRYYVDYTISLGYGVKMPRLGTADALKSMIPVPPYEEQRRIVKSVNEIYHKLEQISSEL